MRTKFLAVAVALMVSLATAHAATPTWVDWTASTQTSATGTIGSTDVTLSGPIEGLSTDSYYYTQSGTTPATYGGLAPSGMIQVAQAGNFTMSFSESVGSLYLSMVSVGNGGEPVTYAFNTPFSVVAFGPNFWGYGGFNVVGNSFTGIEFNGILKLDGNFGPGHDLEFTVDRAENWHGFNVAAVPEPETYAMMMAGLGMIGVMVRRRKS
jgi:hypothetical protein